MNMGLTGVQLYFDLVSCFQNFLDNQSSASENCVEQQPVDEDFVFVC